MFNLHFISLLCDNFTDDAAFYKFTYSHTCLVRMCVCLFRRCFITFSKSNINRFRCVTVMNNLKDSFNALSAVSFTPQIPLLELTDPNGYKILSFRAIFSKWGRGVLAVLDVKGEKYQTFMPKRFESILTDQVIDEYNLAPNLKLVYCGVGPSREHVVRLV